MSLPNEEISPLLLMLRHTQKEESSNQLSPFHVFLTDCSRLSSLKHLRSHTWNNDGSFLRSGRHTYRGNVEMFRLGWRCGLMEEMLGPVTGIQDLEQRWLTMPESKPNVKFTLKMTAENANHILQKMLGFLMSSLVEFRSLI